jgi:hypothetical protein
MSATSIIFWDGRTQKVGEAGPDEYAEFSCRK